MPLDFDDRKRARGHRRGVRHWLALGTTILGVGCSVSDMATPQDAATTVPDTSVIVTDGGGTMLDRVAAIVVPHCATSGCHDAQTSEHGMDLSTGPKIYDAWVNQLGFDHCRNMGRVRVVPGSAETSLVMTMITGPLCESWSRMPPPPRGALSTEQIEVIRAWIGAGAPMGAADASASDAGADNADAWADRASDVSLDSMGTADARDADVSTDPEEGDVDGSTNDATDSATDVAADAAADATPTDSVSADSLRDDANSDAAGDTVDDASTGDADACGSVRRQNPRVVASAATVPSAVECTSTMPCGAGLMCLGTSCGETWTCIPHLQGPGEHPCPPDNVPHCGCDGVTFMSPTSCADRPWAFEGACEDGVSCDASTVPCEAPPVCPPGQAATVINGAFGYCVDVKWCRCNAGTKCPGSFTCNSSTQRCGGPARDQ